MLMNWRLTAARAAPSRQWLGSGTASLRLWEEAGSKLWCSDLQPAPAKERQGRMETCSRQVQCREENQKKWVSSYTDGSDSPL